MDFRTFLVGLCYFLAIVLFLVGLRRMSAARTARGSMTWAAWGMVVATLVTFFWPGMGSTNLALILAALAAGGALAWLAGRKVAVTGLAGMIALYTGLGAGATAAIGAVRLLDGSAQGLGATFLAALGGLAGAVACAGCLVAFARLRGWLGRPLRFKSQNQAGASVLLLALILGLMLPGDYPAHDAMVGIFFVLAIAAGAVFALPVGGPGMPVVIAFCNVLAGLAVTVLGFVLGNDAMIVAGTVAGAAAALLAQVIARTLERSVGGVLFGAHGDGAPDRQGRGAR